LSSKHHPESTGDASRTSADSLIPKVLILNDLGVLLISPWGATKAEKSAGVKTGLGLNVPGE
jgi:hypothetical protein